MPPETRLLVISDLHLGGAPARDGRPAFQMCTERGRAQLARFLRWATAQQKNSQDLQLVIAGDVVDFLAERNARGEFEPFTSDEDEAERKLGAILEQTKAVWDGLREFVKSGAALTVMLGNHDLELSLPKARRLLLETLGPGRVEFLYDNQAFTLGPVLIEHGNRYDDWNAVPHDALREARSQASRRESVAFDALPGSRMVVDIVNPTKEVMQFVDLLKPEDAALLPFLALLAPERFKLASGALQNRVRALRVQYDNGQQPKDRNYIAGDTGSQQLAVAGIGTGSDEDDRLLELAAEAASGGDPNLASSGASFAERWKARLASAYRDRQLSLLLRALRAFSGSSAAAFDMEFEKPQYLTAATESAGRGFDVVIYGHTHLAKKLSLRGRRTAEGQQIARDALYLNCGTWADLMALPQEILGADDAPVSDRALEQLRAFADDLANNRLEAWRRMLPTFADVCVHADGRVDAEVRWLDDQDQPVAVTTDRMRRVLQGGEL